MTRLIRLSPTVLAEMEGALKDAWCQQFDDPTNATYRKIFSAVREQKDWDQKGVVIEADEADIKELKSRAEWNVGANGVCQENIGWSSDPQDRAYWRGRMRAYRALLSQIDKIGGGEF